MLPLFKLRSFGGIRLNNGSNLQTRLLLPDVRRRNLRVSSRKPRSNFSGSWSLMAAKFHGVDFYDIDGLLSEEERAIRDTVRDWVDENLMPVIGEAYVAGKFPNKLVPHMAELV